MCDEESSDGSEEKQLLLTSELIKQLQTLVISVLTNDEEHNVKEAGTLLNIIEKLWQSQPIKSTDSAALYNWLLRLCKEQAIADVSTVKTMMKMMFKMQDRQTSSLVMLRDVAADIHLVLGDTDPEVQLTNQKSFVMLTDRTAVAIAITLLQHIDKTLDDSDWVLQSVKALLQQTNVDANVTELMEKNMCVRLGHMTNAFHELLQAALPYGPCVDLMFKTLTKLYIVITQLVKLHLSQYQSRTGQLSTYFEKLVKLSGTSLTQYVYSMITYIQSVQNEQLQQSHEKKKKSKTVAPNVKAVTLKETKCIPNLIYVIEQYEKFLIQLSKKSKVELMSCFKMSTSRDFRINAASVQQLLHGVDTTVDDDDDHSKENKNLNEETTKSKEPAKKRLKTSAKQKKEIKRHMLLLISFTECSKILSS